MRSSRLPSDIKNKVDESAETLLLSREKDWKIDRAYRNIEENSQLFVEAAEATDELYRNLIIHYSLKVAGKVSEEVFRRYLELLKSVRESYVKVDLAEGFSELGDKTLNALEVLRKNLSKLEEFLGGVDCRSIIVKHSVVVAGKIDAKTFEKYLDLLRKIEDDEIRIGTARGISELDGKEIEHALEVLEENFSGWYEIAEDLERIAKNSTLTELIENLVKTAGIVEGDIFEKYLELLNEISNGDVKEAIISVLSSRWLSREEAIRVIYVLKRHFGILVKVVREIRNINTKTNVAYSSAIIVGKVDEETFGKYLEFLQKVKDDAVKEGIAEEISYLSRSYLYLGREKEIVSYVLDVLDENAEKLNRVFEGTGNDEFDNSLKKNIVENSIEVLLHVSKEAFGRYLEILAQIEDLHSMDWIAEYSADIANYVEEYLKREEAFTRYLNVLGKTSPQARQWIARYSAHVAFHGKEDTFFRYLGILEKIRDEKLMFGIGMGLDRLACEEVENSVLLLEENLDKLVKVLEKIEPERRGLIASYCAEIAGRVDRETFGKYIESLEITAYHTGMH